MFQPTSPIILASKSPRRQELLRLMGLSFSIELKDVDESFPASLSAPEIAVFIAEKKAKAFIGDANHMVITADTIVAINGEILGKPQHHAEAQEMLAKLSGSSHEVYTGVSISYQGKITSFYDKTTVFCRVLKSQEITYYIDNYQPFDKAGSYGIQDWFGLAAVQRIEGSYTNVMGLPTEKLYEHLCRLAGC
ncbi:Maf family protein [Pedobacter nanyangensis]|uniref:Maf family protein n=1 Tax=Pedobacter nanyangensis TaxID=1562389 RepID=UPI000DE31865|nr:Maf family protein [Pedobacter nanyangensis]